MVTEANGKQACTSFSVVTRRRFISLLGAAAAVPSFGNAEIKSEQLALCASVGADLTHYDVDVAAATLTQRETVRLPANVQYAWPHRSRRYLYVASSDTATGLNVTPGRTHHVTAFRIDDSGRLTPHGRAIALPSRPIHLTTDTSSEHVLVTFNSPSAVRVYRINSDGTLGDEVRQREAIEAGVYGHQVRVTSNDRVAILVTRGNDAAGGRPEDPGALKVFRYRNGLLTAEVSIAPNGGYGFGPRHLDFHPTKPWIYVSRERENALSLFVLAGDRVRPEPGFTKDTLSSRPAPRQLAGAVHVHPNGRFVYGVNRADAVTDVDGKRVFADRKSTRLNSSH